MIILCLYLCRAPIVIYPHVHHVLPLEKDDVPPKARLGSQNYNLRRALVRFCETCLVERRRRPSESYLPWIAKDAKILQNSRLVVLGLERGCGLEKRMEKILSWLMKRWKQWRFLRLRRLLFLLLLYEYLNRIRLFLQLQPHLLNLASVPNLVLQMHKAQSSL